MKTYFVEKGWAHNSKPYSHYYQFISLDKALACMVELKTDGYEARLYEADLVDVEYKAEVKGLAKDRLTKKINDLKGKHKLLEETEE